MSLNLEPESLSEHRTVLCLCGDALGWLTPGASQPEPVSEAGVAARLAARLARREHRVVFAVPGADTRLLELPVAREERRHLHTALPFMLEESLTEEIEALHFAHKPLEAGHYAVAVAAQNGMDRWRGALGPLWDKVPWVPEPLLLPWDRGAWTLVCAADDALFRYGRAAGTRLEYPLLGPFLEGLLRQQKPERVLVYGGDETRDRERLPLALRERCEWRRGGLGAVLLRTDDTPPLLDLRQGAYAPRLPYARWWRQTRSLAALLLAALVLHGLALWMELRRLQRQDVALRGEIQALYREVNPRGAVVDAERQLRRQVAALRGGEAGASFTGLLAPLGEAVAAGRGVLLASLNYSRRSGELRLNLLAPDFVAVETLRQRLVDAGLEASLESSSRSGERVRARLRVGAGA